MLSLEFLHKPDSSAFFMQTHISLVWHMGCVQINTFVGYTHRPNIIAESSSFMAYLIHGNIGTELPTANIIYLRRVAMLLVAHSCLASPHCNIYSIAIYDNISIIWPQYMLRQNVLLTPQTVLHYYFSLGIGTIILYCSPWEWSQ